MLRLFTSLVLLLIVTAGAEARPHHSHAHQWSGADVSRHHAKVRPFRAGHRHKARRHVVRHRARVRAVAVAAHVDRQHETTEQQDAPHQAAGGRGKVIRSGAPAGCPARLWCGCWLAQHFGLNSRSLWWARAWAEQFQHVAGPAPGVVGVWKRGRGGHVGVVTGVPRTGVVMVLSGNDGGAVRERERSTRGLLAWVVVK